MPGIVGYSERGLVNALFESIVSAKNPQETLRGFLETTTCVANRNWINKFPPGGPILDFEVFIEPSLSNFGNPDVVLIYTVASNSKKAGSSQQRDTISNAIFIEAKLCTFKQSVNHYDSQKDANSLDLSKNSSSILHELFLKAKFEYYLKHDIEKLHKGFPIYMRDKKKSYKRKIGSDPVVLDLVKQIQECSEIYFMALTTDRGDEEGPDPERFKAGTYIHDMFEEISKKNNSVDPNIDAKMWHHRWEELTYLLSWHDIYKEAKGLFASGENSMKRLVNTIEWNRTKFRFSSLHDRKLLDMRDRLIDKLGCSIGPERKSEDRVTVYKMGRARFTCRIADSFDDDSMLETYLRFPKKKRSSLFISFSDIEVFCNFDQVSSNIDDLIKVCT